MVPADLPIALTMLLLEAEWSLASGGEGQQTVVGFRALNTVGIYHVGTVTGRAD